MRALQSNFGTERETVIFKLESLAVYLSLQLFETTIRGANIVMFTDNEGVHGAFVRNWTENAFVQKIIDEVGTAEECLNVFIWYERVPSSSNPADTLSRGELFEGGNRCQVTSAFLRKVVLSEHQQGGV